MAGKLRYWKEKDGRFWARMAVPADLKPLIGKSEIIEPLGGDRREAIRKHPAAVARLQARLDAAKHSLTEPAAATLRLDPISTADFSRAVWERYSAALTEDAQSRDLQPDAAQIEELRKEAEVRLQGVDPENALAILDGALDYLVAKRSRETDAYIRQARLTALREALAAGETQPIEVEVDDFLARNQLKADVAERSVLAHRLMRTEIEALARTIERDQGNYAGVPADPLVRPAAAAERPSAPVSLSKLWDDYVAGRVVAGFMKDGGKRQAPVIKNFRKFLGHNDAARVAKADVIAWREHLIHEEKLASKTVNDIYLSTVRSLFSWAKENERLAEDVAAGVKQPKPRRVLSRERGYTDEEALAVLKFSRSHVPKPNNVGFVRETPHMTAAKRWVPLICAFTGARVSEITQLRKEDVRAGNGGWQIRITPDAGSVKAGGYRDVPLHRQLVQEGFIQFVEAAGDGPLFHGVNDPERYATGAASVSDELAKWLRRAGITPEGVQPNHGWRHRFKTQGRDLGLSDRVIDAIQGHAGRTASDGYGDVSVTAKMRVIDALPDYQI